jgi:hypothetical protein
VSLADQQIKDQRRFLQTRANNNTELSCSGGFETLAGRESPQEAAGCVCRQIGLDILKNGVLVWLPRACARAEQREAR